MFREILRVTTEDLHIKLPKNLLNKTIEILVFPVVEEKPVEKKKNGRKKDAGNMGFDSVKISTKKWKFDRSEIYEE